MLKAGDRETARKEAVRDIEERTRRTFKSFLWVRTETEYIRSLRRWQIAV
jgi:hypothetical protein